VSTKRNRQFRELRQRAGLDGKTRVRLPQKREDVAGVIHNLFPVRGRRTDRKVQSLLRCFPER